MLFSGDLRRLKRAASLIFYFFSIYALWSVYTAKEKTKQQKLSKGSFLLENKHWPEPLCFERSLNTTNPVFPQKALQFGPQTCFDNGTAGAVVYRDTDRSSGWGNRLLGIASAFVLSAVLEKPFYIDSECFTKAFAYGPAAAPWNKSSLGNIFQRGSIRTTLSFRERDLILQRIWPGYRRPYRELALVDPAWWFRDKRGARANIIFVESNQWFVPTLFLNPHLRHFLCYHFGTDVFRTVSQNLWVPNAIVENVLQNFCARTNSLCSDQCDGSVRVIGVHIRSEASAPRWRPYRVRGPRLDSMLRCITLAQNTLEAEFDRRLLRIFIASDSPTLLEELRKLRNAPPFLALDPETDARHVPDEYRELVIAAAEMILLSRCTFRVLSVGSTFGMCAHASSASLYRPFVVTERGDCVQIPSRDPCQHHFYRLGNLHAFETIADFTNSRRFGCII
ncbi:hypothetical protein CCYA_CCYA17G4333 [Cyanidiococcus yangmingshanensis]|nr:hypothetical protein CCYA_CCYA17G4333 [Cyanidiococcus yangmingshanensis]